MNQFQKSSSFIAGLFVFIFATPVLADNGATAFARPINNLVVDGNSDDWPANALSFPIKKKWQTDQEVSAEDFSATFRAGFNASKKELYFLIEVRDESHVDDHSRTKEQDSSWQFCDACILYLDTQHSPKGSGSQIFLAFGDQRETIGKKNAWDPKTGTASWENVDLAVKRKGNLTTYEWKFENFPSIEAGRTIGLDFLICDSDQQTPNNSSIYFWGEGDGKSSGGGRLGDLTLLSPDEKLFNAAGKFKWKEPAAKETQGFPASVQLTSTSTDSLATTVLVDESGNFKATLPKGEYRVSLPVEVAEDVRDEQSRRIELVETPVVSIGEKSDQQEMTIELSFKAMPHFKASASPLFEYASTNDAELIRVLDRYRNYFNVPGYSIALIHDGQLVFQNAAGHTNHLTGDPVDENTLFEAASITKTVFAFAANRLAEKGEIDLDKPLFEHLEFAEMSHDPRVEKITARHCLNHSSGLPNWFNVGTKMLFDPGTKFGYSGSAMEYLGRVIEQTQNKPLEQVVKDEACGPLGFTESVFFSECEQLRAVASFGHINNMPQAHDNDAQIGVASSMFTESKAFSKFMIALMNRQGLSPSTYEQMFELSMPNEQSDGEVRKGFGLGFQIEDSPRGKIISHGGNNGDFQCLFEIFDKSKDGFVIFTNADSGGDFIAAIRKYLVDGKVGDRPGNSQPRQLSVSELDKLQRARIRQKV